MVKLTGIVCTKCHACTGTFVLGTKGLVKMTLNSLVKEKHFKTTQEIRYHKLFASSDNGNTKLCTCKHVDHESTLFIICLKYFENIIKVYQKF